MIGGHRRKACHWGDRFFTFLSANCSLALPRITEERVEVDRLRRLQQRVIVDGWTDG